MSNLKRRGKRYRECLKQYDVSEVYSLDEALAILKKFPEPKFDQSLTLAFLLGVDARKVDQKIRTSVVLPNGTGKTPRIVVFADGEQMEVAKKLEVDYCGDEELIEKIKGGWLEFDVVIATPGMMKDVGKLGRILGARGLMPSPKDGTVTAQIEPVVTQLRKGRVSVVSDRLSGLHVLVGKNSFAEDDIKGNIQEVYRTVQKSKPATAKGTYILRLSLSGAMTPGITVNHETILGGRS